MNTKPPLVIICGPTASGKSALALALARTTPSTIINMDASQVYADLRILSARPSDEEMAGVPHRLYGYIDGTESCTAARWATEARAVVAEAHDAGRLPILVGGTGLYMRTLLEGIAPVPEITPDVRAAVRALPVAAAHAALSVEDPRAATRLNAADTTRVARALEVVRATGRPLHDWQNERVGGIGGEVCIVPLVLLPPRDWVMARCDARFAMMIQNGALAEVAALLARGLDPALPVMRAIGVRELAPLCADTGRSPEYEAERFGSGLLSAQEHGNGLTQAIATAQLATRQYAKRQYTWFRNQCPADWLRATEIVNNAFIDKLAIKLRNDALTC